MKSFFTGKLEPAQLNNKDFEELRKDIAIELLRFTGWCIPQKFYITKQYFLLYYKISKIIYNIE